MTNTVKPLKPRFYAQETPNSCAPACLRMVFSIFGREIPEADLRQLCDCTPTGTDALKAVDAARQLGFFHTAKHTLSVTELEDLLANHQFPIIFVDLAPIDGIYEPHALVVIGISDTAIQVYDPAKGERFIPRQSLIVAWARRHYPAIIVEP